MATYQLAFQSAFLTQHPREIYKIAHAELADFLSRLETVDPLVIDYFLGQNLHLEDVGKFLIAWVILEAESKERTSGNYIRHITHVISLGCRSSSDIHKNRVKFITFNYDTTLERRIRNALNGLSVFDPDDIDKFCSGGRFQHVYGAVNDGQSARVDFTGLFRNENSLNATLNRTVQIIDTVLLASEKLLVIDPENKSVSAEHKSDLQNTIRTANTLILLGFGFDRFNANLLALEDVTTYTNIERILLTNYNDVSRINQIAGKFFQRSHSSLEGNLFGLTMNCSLRKSVRTTDDALALDFDIE